MPNNRLALTFQAARGEGKKMLCPFVTAGFPSLEATPLILKAIQDASGPLTVIELGIPFSDPVADGPIIQASYTHALGRGATVDACLATVKAARALGLTIPVVSMVSFSIIFKRGTVAFAKACVENQLDGIVLPDIPLEEAPEVVDVLSDHGLRSILLVAPTSPPERRAAIARLCDGFVYYLSVSGITGERKSLPPDIAPNIAELRTYTQTPICVGFGIATADQVREVTAVADGAIVGSALIRRLKFDQSPQEAAKAAGAFVKELSAGIP